MEGGNLKWKNHVRELFHRVGDLRRVESLSDVTLVCRDGETPFLLHKIVLAACSSFFEKVFTSTTAGSAAGGTKVLVMAETEPEMMRLLVDFMYLGEVSVPACDMEKFMRTAERLGIRGLTEQGTGSGEGYGEDEEGGRGGVKEYVVAGDTPLSSGSKQVLGEASAVSSVDEACGKEAKKLDDRDDGSCDSDVVEVLVQGLKTEMGRARDPAHVMKMNAPFPAPCVCCGGTHLPLPPAANGGCGCCDGLHPLPQPAPATAQKMNAPARAPCVCCGGTHLPLPPAANGSCGCCGGLQPPCQPAPAAAQQRVLQFPTGGPAGSLLITIVRDMPNGDKITFETML